MTEPDFKLIKKNLRYGEIKTLAEAHKISKSAAYKILNGETKNFEFLKACYEKAIERAMMVKAFNEKLQSL